MGSYQGPNFSIPGVLAGESLAAEQYKVMKFASTAGEVKTSDAATDNHVGILQNDPGDGEAAEVVCLGISLALASDGSITAGSALTSDTTGRVNGTTSDAANIVGWALEASGAANDLIQIVVQAPSRFNT